MVIALPDRQVYSQTFIHQQIANLPYGTGGKSSHAPDAPGAPRKPRHAETQAAPKAYLRRAN